jgi:YD repeat-containing protein
MKTGFKYFLFLLVTITRAEAQITPPQLPTIITPSPDVQALQKYGDIPVSIYTGVPDISVPIYTIHYRDITVPITINYHASGIRTTEEASRVGLGWSLNAGGNISRNIVGLDDLASGAFLSGHEDYTSIPLGNSQPCCIAQFATAPSDTIGSEIFGNETNFDLQPDQYYFNFLGHSGKFILLRSTKQAILQSQEKIKIVFDQTGEYPIWHITDLEGFVYEFVQFETVSPTNSITAWYLAKITSPLGNQITFNYVGLPGSSSSPTYSETLIGDPVDNFSPAPAEGTALYLSSESTYNLLALSSISYSNGLVQFHYSGRTDDGDQKLDSVSVFNLNEKGYPLSNPLQTTVFNYSYFHGDANPISASWLIYGNDSLRLRLDSVKEFGYFNGQAAALPPYIFSYNQSIPLPAKSTSGNDHWGYYNGKSNGFNYIPSIVTPVVPLTNNVALKSTGYLGPERNTDTSYAQVYSLASIQNPTGGLTQFQYESNDFDEQASEVNDGSVFNLITDILPQSQQFTYEVITNRLLSYTNGSTTGVATNVLDLSNAFTNTTINLTAEFTLPSTPQNCLNLFSGVQNEPQLAQIGYAYFELYDSSGNLVLHVDPATLPYYSQLSADQDSSVNTYELCTGVALTIHHYPALTLAPGKYTLRTYISGTGYSANLTGMAVTVTWNTAINSTPPAGCDNCITYGYAGGLRIKQITDYDGINPANNKVRKYIYNYYADKNGDGIPEEYSYGRRMTKPRYFADAVTYYLSDFGHPTIFGKYSSHSLFQLNGSASGSVVGYDQVTEIQGLNGENGETIYKYYNQPDGVQNFYDPNIGYPITPPYGATIPYMENGSLLEKTIYKKDGGTFVKVEYDSNAYSLRQQSIVYGLDWRIWQTPDGVYYTNAHTYNTGPADMYLYPAIVSKWFPLIYSSQTKFDQYDTTKSRTITKNYYYDDTSHLLPTRITINDSKGEIVTTTTHYPLDFGNLTGTDATTLGIKNLQNNHIISTPIEMFVQKANPDGSNLRTTDAIFTSYNNNAALPDTIYKAKITGSSTTFVAATGNGSAVVKDPSYEPRIVFNEYDKYGNTIEQAKAADISYSYIWDYDSIYPVARISNAVQSDVAYTSFEADGTGNWTIVGGIVDTAVGITGSNSYIMSGTSTVSTSTLNSATTYIVTYWTENKSAFNIVGTISGYPVQGKTEMIKGHCWTLYVHKITGQTTVSINGSGHIDELRLYPSTAQMTTYTYSPLVGMTSQTDIGNRVTYYEYDGLQRLKRIRDQDYNILKTYEYQYQVAAGCNGCQTVAMETFAGTNTIGYPVGMFDIHGNLVGNAAGASAYIGLWNSDTADARVGTLSAGNDSLHFNIVLNAGQTLPASVTGCRYYQVDLPDTVFDGVRNFNGTYVDFGDGTGMHLGTGLLDIPAVIAPNTTHGTQAVDVGYTIYPGVVYDHTYPNSNLKTLTFYHNDAGERSDFDNLFSPAPSLTLLRNFRGNLPLNTPNIGGSCYQQSTMTAVANITNWNSIHSIQNFRLNNGDKTNPCENIGYPQDFLVNNPGLISIATNWTSHHPGNGDSTFKLTRLKNNWNTYFTQLQSVGISEDDWNRENLSGLTNLRAFSLTASGQVQDDPNSPLVPLDSTEIDNILIQIAAGAGQNVRNGTIGLLTAGSNRTGNSDAAYNFLVNNRGWTIVIDTTDR